MSVPHYHWKTGQPCTCGFHKEEQLQPPKHKCFTGLHKHIRGQKRYWDARTDKRLSAANPEWLQQYIDQHGPYLYHGTTPAAQEQILQNGLYPHNEVNGETDYYDCPNCGASSDEHTIEANGDECPHCDYQWDYQWDHTNQSNHEGFFQTRPGHTYMGTHEYITNTGYPKGSLLAIDLRKLDPQKMKADEDQFYDSIHNGGVRHYDPELINEMEQRNGMYGGPPNAYDWQGPGYDTLGDWADRVNLGHDPRETQFSLNKGSIGYEGHVPADAIQPTSQTQGQWKPLQ